jgi:hypothetical protein
VETVRYRYNVSILVAGVVMFCGGMALATSRWWLAPVLLVPVTMIVWGLRAGTDVDERGLRLRALVGSRWLEWTEINGFTRHGDRILVTLASGRAVPLPAVNPDDLPALLRASGQPSDVPVPNEPDDEADSDAAAGAD